VTPSRKLRLYRRRIEVIRDMEGRKLIIVHLWYKDAEWPGSVKESPVRLYFRFGLRNAEELDKLPREMEVVWEVEDPPSGGGRVISSNDYSY